MTTRKTSAEPPAFDRFRGTERYVASRELRDAVNVAIAIERPLLVKGEPGTGKTVLAEHIAEGLGLELLKWPVKSTSKAVDGLYTYDTVQRLNDARFGDHDVSDIRRYIRLGPLGTAFTASERKVVLIDEIDKGDIEFPNDLLQELDDMAFGIVETGERFTAKHRPVVIITSNSEKELPDPFLRRCVFHYIEFPAPDLMAEIIKVHYPDLSEALMAQAVARFYALRSVDALRKKPSTSELLDWIGVLLRCGVSADALRREIPFVGTLLKKDPDLRAYTAGAIRLPG